MTALRTRSPELLWDMTLEEAFSFTKAKLSSSGTKEAWIRGSSRGFDASARLAMAYFGPDFRLGDIDAGACQNYVDLLALLPNIWNKGGKCSLRKTRESRVQFQSLIDITNDLEDARLSQIEERAEAESWSQEKFRDNVAAARVKRLAPATQYKQRWSQEFGPVAKLWRLTKD